MKINGLSLPAESTLSVEKPTPEAQVAKKSPKQVANTEASQKAPDDPNKVPGVIRLLQEGHFKGVADVRLRINFFDELQALQARELRSAAGQALPAFLEAMDQSLTTLLVSESLSAEQTAAIMAAKDTFTQTVAQLLENFQVNDNVSQETLITEIDQSFHRLTDSLAMVLAPGEAGEEISVLPDETAEEAADLDSVPEVVPGAPETAATDVEALLEALKSIYASAFDTLKEALAEATILPPLSEPEGKGQAYAKFLAIYNELLTGAPPGEISGGETLDTVV